MAIAARQLQQKGKLSKILIVDWVSPLGPPAHPCSSPGHPQVWVSAPSPGSELELDWRAVKPPPSGPAAWLGPPRRVRMGEQEQILGMGDAALEQGWDPVAFSSVRLLGHPQG